MYLRSLVLAVAGLAVPGGAIEITGSHDDVWRHQAGRGQPPRLGNRRKANNFHRPRS